MVHGEEERVAGLEPQIVMDAIVGGKSGDEDQEPRLTCEQVRDGEALVQETAGRAGE